MRFLSVSSLSSVALAASAGLATAAGLGQPEKWQLGLQQAASQKAAAAHDFHTLLLWIITIITLLVAGLLVFVIFRFNEKKNPEPSKTTHNTLIEIVWTIVPILILVSIAIPSFRLLYLQREIPKADLVIKATGNQWNWSYEYPEIKDADGEAISFDAVMKAEDELEKGDPRNLASDSPVVVPVGKVVKVTVTASDVLHAWAVPAFGVRIDAVPGRLNELWFKPEKTGVFYGQCSELCGKDHAFMPIEVRVVSEADYKKWVEEAKTAGLDKANKNLIAKMKADRNGRRIAKLKTDN